MNDRHTRVMFKGSLRLLGLATVLVLAGCTTIISGGRDAGEKPGIRYYLPAPHIVLEPQSDGTVKVEPKYFPDPNNAYTLNIASYLSSATFDVTLVDGMLSKLNLDADSTAVANKVTVAATELEKQKLAAKQKEREEERAKEDAKKAEVKTAAEAVRLQEEKIALMEGKLKFYDNNPNDFDPAELRKLKLDLKLEISQERIKLEQLQTRLGLAKSGDSASNDPRDAFLDPRKDDPGMKSAFGPVFFRVLPDNSGVKLVALEGQRTYQTSTSAEPLASDEQTLKFSPSAAIVKKDAANRDIVVNFSKSIKTIYKMDTRLVRPADGVTAPPVLLGDQLAMSLEGVDAKSLRILLPKNVPEGAYRLDVVLQVRGSTDREQVSLPIHWLME